MPICTPARTVISCAAGWFGRLPNSVQYSSHCPALNNHSAKLHVHYARRRRWLQVPEEGANPTPAAAGDVSGTSTAASAVNLPTTQAKPEEKALKKADARRRNQKVGKAGLPSGGQSAASAQPPVLPAAPAVPGPAALKPAPEVKPAAVRQSPGPAAAPGTLPATKADIQGRPPRQTPKAPKAAASSKPRPPAKAVAATAAEPAAPANAGATKAEPAAAAQPAAPQEGPPASSLPVGTPAPLASLAPAEHQPQANILSAGPCTSCGAQPTCTPGYTPWRLTAVCRDLVTAQPQQGLEHVAGLGLPQLGKPYGFPANRCPV